MREEGGGRREEVELDGLQFVEETPESLHDCVEVNSDVLDCVLF